MRHPSMNSRRLSTYEFMDATLSAFTKGVKCQARTDVGQMVLKKDTTFCVLVYHEFKRSCELRVKSAVAGVTRSWVELTQSCLAQGANTTGR